VDDYSNKETNVTCLWLLLNKSPHAEKEVNPYILHTNITPGN